MAGGRQKATSTDTHVGPGRSNVYKNIDTGRSSVCLCDMLYESLRAAGYGQYMNSSDLRYSGPVSRPGSGPMSSARWPRRAQESRPRMHTKHPDHRGRSALPWEGPAARRSLSGRTPFPGAGKGLNFYTALYSYTVDEITNSILIKTSLY